MLHLPALVLLKQASQVFGTLAQFGLVIRGTWRRDSGFGEFLSDFEPIDFESLGGRSDP